MLKKDVIPIYDWKPLMYLYCLYYWKFFQLSASDSLNLCMQCVHN